MVHIGAMAGAALSQGHSTSLGFSTGLFRRFQNPKDKRDFVTAGTAVGIAVHARIPSPHSSWHSLTEGCGRRQPCRGVSTDLAPHREFIGLCLI